jgi:hypothetical protein
MKKRKVSQRRKVSRRGKVSRRNKIGGDGPEDTDIFSNSNVAESDLFDMKIEYIPVGSSDEEKYEYLKTNNEPDRIGSFVISLIDYENNITGMTGGATICTQGSTHVPRATYTEVCNQLLAVNLAGSVLRDRLGEMVTRRLVGVSGQPLTGINEPIIAVVKDSYGAATQIIINIFQYRSLPLEVAPPNHIANLNMLSGVPAALTQYNGGVAVVPAAVPPAIVQTPIVRGKNVAHGTIHQYNAAGPPNQLFPVGHNFGAQHAQNDPRSVVMSIQWKMCGQYNCPPPGNPIGPTLNNVRFSIKHRWTIAQGAAAAGVLQNILKSVAVQTAWFIEGMVNPNMANLPWRNLDLVVKQFLVDRLREACQDIRDETAIPRVVFNPNGRRPAERRVVPFPASRDLLDFNYEDPWVNPPPPPPPPPAPVAGPPGGPGP